MLENLDKHILYNNVVAQSGVRWNINKCIEEMAELIVELSRYDSERLNMNKIATEMAHVAITTEKLMYYWGLIQQVEEEKEKVIEHLKLLLKDKVKEEFRWRGLDAEKSEECKVKATQEEDIYKIKGKVNMG